jgi:hypothetical protein
MRLSCAADIAADKAADKVADKVADMASDMPLSGPKSPRSFFEARPQVRPNEIDKDSMRCACLVVLEAAVPCLLSPLILIPPWAGKENVFFLFSVYTPCALDHKITNGGLLSDKKAQGADFVVPRLALSLSGDCPRESHFSFFLSKIWREKWKKRRNECMGQKVIVPP